MKMMLLIGAAAVGLTAGVSQAATHHRHVHHGDMASAGAYAQPQRPIAYTELSAYLKAPPRQRASRDWGAQMAAATGSSVNAAASMPAPPAADASQPATGAAAPSPDAAPAQTPMTAPPDVNATPNQAPVNAPAPANPEPPASNAPAAQPQQPPQ